eukprot:2494635-Rhodomonas_salina.1
MHTEYAHHSTGVPGTRVCLSEWEGKPGNTAEGRLGYPGTRGTPGPVEKEKQAEGPNLRQESKKPLSTWEQVHDENGQRR